MADKVSKTEKTGRQARPKTPTGKSVKIIFFKKKESFIMLTNMEVLSIYELPFQTVFLMFLIFSFVGWVSEVIYVGILSEHKFVNRGFLHGPICPIYGFGGVVILLLPKVLYSTWIPLFFCSMILCTCVEYFASWILEKMFHTLWWDYSHYKVNLNGRVCLVNSVLFGIMGVVTIHFVMPLVMYFMNWYGERRIAITSHILGGVLAFDIVLTIKSLVDYNMAIEKIKSFKDNLKSMYGQEEWFKSSTIGEMLESVKERAKIEKDRFSQGFIDNLESVLQEHKKVDVLIRKFPTLTSKVYHDEIAHLRVKIKENIKEKIKN